MKKEEEGEKEFEEDVSFEDEPEEESTFSGSTKKLREKLKKCVSEKQEYLDGWQRSKADFINYKKGEEKRIDTARKFANEGLIRDFLSVLDSFESAKASNFWNEAEDDWKSGVESIIRQMEVVLEAHGLRKIKEVDNFDPNLHESVEMIPTDEKAQDGIIKEVVQTGYKLKDKVLRPAKVKVNVYKE